MYTNTAEVKTYDLKAGRNEVEMHEGAEIKETYFGKLLVVQPRDHSSRRRVIWVFGCNERVDDFLYERLSYIGSWHSGTTLQTVWEEKI